MAFCALCSPTLLPNYHKSNWIRKSQLCRSLFLIWKFENITESTSRIEILCNSYVFKLSVVSLWRETRGKIYHEFGFRNRWKKIDRKRLFLCDLKFRSNKYPLPCCYKTHCYFLKYYIHAPRHSIENASGTFTKFFIGIYFFTKKYRSSYELITTSIFVPTFL